MQFTVAVLNLKPADAFYVTNVHFFCIAESPRLMELDVLSLAPTLTTLLN